jgi:prepilin-type N-terminal cleavage/methylation domain-containing protein
MRTRGFTILEMMMVVGLLTIVFAIAATLTRWSLMANYESQQSAVMDARLDDMVRTIRRDIWQASAIESPNPQTVRVTDADGHQITWTFGPGDSVHRTAEVERSWPELVGGISTGRNGGVIELTIPRTRLRNGQTISLASQIILAGGKQP